MKNFDFNFNDLFSFAQTDPYGLVSENYQELFKYLENSKQELNFPAVNNDIGCLLNLLTKIYRPHKIFEMGSGYGHSCFWYFVGNSSPPGKVVLTEKRSDLLEVFEAAPWPLEWKESIAYYQGDAFEVLNQAESFDWYLIDGVKADYLRFLKAIEDKTKAGSLVFIDNSYWRGSFLDKELSQTKASAKNIKELHEYIKNSTMWEACFVPFKDGLSILRKI